MHQRILDEGADALGQLDLYTHCLRAMRSQVRLTEVALRLANLIAFIGSPLAVLVFDRETALPVMIVLFGVATGTFLAVHWYHLPEANVQLKWLLMQTKAAFRAWCRASSAARGDWPELEDHLREAREKVYDLESDLEDTKRSHLWARAKKNADERGISRPKPRW